MKAMQTRCPQKSPCSVQRFRARFKRRRRRVSDRLLQAPLFPVGFGWPWRKTPRLGIASHLAALCASRGDLRIVGAWANQEQGRSLAMADRYRFEECTATNAAGS
jgi:hypothetical protein